jgi:hypothetical protein
MTSRDQFVIVVLVKIVIIERIMSDVIRIMIFEPVHFLEEAFHSFAVFINAPGL